MLRRAIQAVCEGDFCVDPRQLRAGLFKAGLIELPVKGDHVLGLLGLPENLHKDSFDRIILAHAHFLKCPLVTSDSKLIEHAGEFIKIIANR